MKRKKKCEKLVKVLRMLSSLSAASLGTVIIVMMKGHTDCFSSPGDIFPI